MLPPLLVIRTNKVFGIPFLLGVQIAVQLVKGRFGIPIGHATSYLALFVRCMHVLALILVLEFLLRFGWYFSR